MTSMQYNREGERDPVDRYETPDSVTRALLKRFDFTGKVLEPACGTGRMVRVLRDELIDAEGYDLVEDGFDFLTHDYGTFNHVITNPPYKGALAYKFALRALETVPGTVALLVRTGFLAGKTRYRKLFDQHKPSHILFVSERIHFYYAEGYKIANQVHDNAWVIWRGNPIGDVKPIDFIGPDETPDVGKPDKCAYCADTGWFYSEKELGPCPHCAAGRKRQREVDESESDSLLG